MVNVLQYTVDTYLSNIRFLLLFSIAFVIAFLIPAFASFPTYNDAGAIFVRTASLFMNLNIFNTAVIVLSVFFSLLFMSFAVVAINIVVKHSRTHTRIKREVLEGLERYTAKVFAVLLLYVIIIFIANVLTYNMRYSSLLTACVGIVLAPLFFYSPASIVIDDHKILRAMKASAKFFLKRLDYALLWLCLSIALLTVFDLIFIAIGGPVLSRYLMLIFNSLFILPFLVLLQSELYMKRFKLLSR
jgi:hypothetical protein